MKCQLCSLDAEYVDLAGMQPLCWLHASDRRQTSSRVEHAFFVGENIHPDGGRASGDAICEACKREFRCHPDFLGVLGYDGRPFLTLLCDGWVVKL